MTNEASAKYLNFVAGESFSHLNYAPMNYAPMSNVIIPLGGVRFEVTFEDAQNFELIQWLPTEDIYVSAQGEFDSHNLDIFPTELF